MLMPVAAAALILSAAAPAGAISGVPSWTDAPLVVGNLRDHPDPALSLPGPDFNVYTGAALPAGWTLQASLSVNFANSNMYGRLDSQAWQYTDSHMLFAYRVANTGVSGNAAIRSGNVTGFASGWKFLDSGILDYGGDVAFDQGDVLNLWRTNGQAQQFGFSFQSYYPFMEKLLMPGETSSWFYFETDAWSWTIGTATVQDSGASASPIPVLIPVPEPVTMAGMLLGIGGLTGYVARRRTAR